MKLAKMALVGLAASFFLFIGKPAFAVYTQTVTAVGGQPFSGARLSFVTDSGETGTVTQDPNDSRKIMIAVPDGTTGGTLTVNRGLKTSKINIAIGGGPVLVNTSAGTARVGHQPMFNNFPLQVGVFGTVGKAYFSGRHESGSGSTKTMDDIDLLKFGVGAVGRVGLPMSWPFMVVPTFVQASFTSYPGRQDSDSKNTASNQGVEIEENWDTRVYIGITPWRLQQLEISLLAGIAITNFELASFAGTFRDDQKRTVVNPTFGIEFASPLSAFANIANIANWANIANTGEPIWFMGGQLDVLSDIKGGSSDNRYRGNGNVQWRMLTGIRYPF